jgi:hypothetical protein
MAPRYVRDFAARTSFASPDRDVFDGLGKKLDRLFRQAPPSIEGIALLGDARDVAARARAALRARGRPDRARLVVTSPPYLRVVKYGYYNWLRTWFLGFDARAIDAALDDAHHREPYLAFLRDVLAGLRPVLADDAVVVLVIGDVETDRGRRIRGGVGLAERAWEAAAEPEGYRLAGVALDDIGARPRPAGGGRWLASPTTSIGPGRRGPCAPSRIAPMQPMYHPSDLAAMDPLVLMKNLDHVRMTSRRLSYILQQQVHLYTPEANQLREQIDRYVEAERQIEGEMARRRIRA